MRIRNLFGRSNQEDATIFVGPENACLYAIGDIHGRADLLDQLLTMIREDASKHSQPSQLIFLGDYIDRGLRSRNVIDLCIEIAAQAHKEDDWLPPIFLKGNHEEALLGFIQDPNKYQIWLEYGGLATLASYGVRIGSHSTKDNSYFLDIATKLRDRLPSSHFEFLNSLASLHQSGDFIFVHAAIDPAVPINAQKSHTLFWAEQSDFKFPAGYEQCVVHGHTITPAPTMFDFHISIDTGAYYSGRLTALKIQGQFCEFIETSNRS